MTVGSVLEQTFGLYQRFFWRFVAITAIVMIALDAGFDLLWIVVIVVSLVGSVWVQGALSFAVADVRDGSADSTTGELFSRTRPVLGTLILVGVWLSQLVSDCLTVPFVAVALTVNLVRLHEPAVEPGAGPEPDPAAA